MKVYLVLKMPHYAATMQRNGALMVSAVQIVLWITEVRHDIICIFWARGIVKSNILRELKSHCYSVYKIAYPIGDQRTFPNQMTDAHAMAPFPNAIVFNWVTLIVLAFGNMGALDFQARCMAAKSAKIATIGCLVAGVLCIILGVPFAYLGSIARLYYGPDTARASYETDVRYIDVSFPFYRR
jgi:hypothetical protein